MSSFEDGLAVTRIVTTVGLDACLSCFVVNQYQAPMLGYFPVAAHFKLFDALVELGTPATSEDILEAYKRRLPAGENAGSAPGILQLLCKPRKLFMR